MPIVSSSGKFLKLNPFHACFAGLVYDTRDYSSQENKTIMLKLPDFTFQTTGGTERSQSTSNLFQLQVKMSFSSINPSIFSDESIILQCKILGDKLHDLDA